MIIIRLQRKSYALVHDRYNLLRMVGCPFICLINSEPLSTFNHQKGNGINILMCARWGRSAPRNTAKMSPRLFIVVPDKVRKKGSLPGMKSHHRIALNDIGFCRRVNKKHPCCCYKGVRPQASHRTSGLDLRRWARVPGGVSPVKGGGPHTPTPRPRPSLLSLTRIASIPGPHKADIFTKLC